MSFWNRVTGRHRGSVRDTLGARVDAADRRFVALAAQLEAGSLAAARELSLRAFSLLPLASKKTSLFFSKLGDETEARFRSTQSVLLESVPAAARRTASTFDKIAKTSTQRARRTADLLFPRAASSTVRIEGYLRDVGRWVSALAREGLDAVPVGQSVRARLLAIRRQRGGLHRKSHNRLPVKGAPR